MLLNLLVLADMSQRMVAAMQQFDLHFERTVAAAEDASVACNKDDTDTGCMESIELMAS